MTDLNILREIEASDPDGGCNEPTPQDHAAHQNWAIMMFGRKAWDDYCRSGWDDQEI